MGPAERFARASGRIVFYLGEGAGWSEAEDRRRFYVLARGNALEAVEALVLLRASAALTAAQYAEAKELVVRVMAMLTQLAKPAMDGTEVGDEDR